MLLELESESDQPSNANAYVVLARKWRPAQFADIVGQTHIVRTLMNAIKSSRIHQAYLFTGTRGTGKTSVARIFSKVLRCEQTKWEGEWLQSCDQCSSCREITSSSSVDVIEIDGASNNGVEAVREIRENAKFMPSYGTRKIYIIDEVHMLTTAAFNALLKTLEEPPPHVVFIFATTEPHKIPATILSRVQRFDFRRVNLAQIQARLVQVAQAEKIEADPAALALIARAAEGSMRDSLSLLDQVIAFSGAKITTETVRESIGLVETQALVETLKAIFGRHAMDAVQIADRAYAQGHDLRVFARSLLELLHAVILIKAGATRLDGLEFSAEQTKDIQALASMRDLEEMELIFQVIHQGVEWIARSPQPKIILDVLLIKCATAEALGYVESPGSGGNVRSPQTQSQPLRTPTVAPTSSSMATSPITPIPPPNASPAAAIRAQLSAQQTPSAPHVKKVATPAAPVAKPEQAPQAGPKTWEKFIESVRANRPLLASILEHGECLTLPSETSNILAIGYNPREVYYKEQIQARAYQEQLLVLIKAYFGAQSQLKIEEHQGGESLASKKEREQQSREKDARQAALNHPVILEAKAIFGGEMGPIELQESE